MFFCRITNNIYIYYIYIYIYILIEDVLILIEDVENKELCKLKLTEDDVSRLRDSIEDLYYFEFVIGK